jgi:hypothetical protein
MPAEAALVSAAVRDLVVAERVSPSSDTSMACLYHLIPRDRASQYRTATARFHAPDVTVSGPWPAFAFVPDPWA